MRAINADALIQRLKAIHEAEKQIYGPASWDFTARCIQAVEDAPTIEPGPKWIPCSEKLPDRFGKVLVTFIPAAGTLWTRVIIAHYFDLMGIAKPCFWIGNVGKNDFANITGQVVAWMPLPEPYKEDCDARPD